MWHLLWSVPHLAAVMQGAAKEELFSMSTWLL